MEKRIVFSLFSFLLSFVPWTSGQFPCPDPEDISPCTCSYDEETREIIADCSSATTSEIFSVFHDVVWFSKLTMFDAMSSDKITELSEGIFGNVTFERISTYICPNFSTVHPSVLLASKDVLEVAWFQFGRLEEFPWHVVPQMVALKQIFVSSNALTSVPPLHSPTLQMLRLSDNRIPSLEGEWFLPDIFSIDIGENPVSEFPTGFFNDFRTLQVFICSDCRLGPTLHSGSLEFNTWRLIQLSLERNNITTIEAGAILGYTPETEMNLDENLITEVKEEVFRPILEVISSGEGFVSLLGNPIQCVCSMAWLVLNQTLLAHVHGECGGDGPTFQELDPFLFEDFCIKMNPPMPGDYSSWI